MRVPEITTDRLKLEPISMEHSKGMFELWSDSSVCQYSGVISDCEGNVIEVPVTNAVQSDLIIDFWLKAASDGWGVRWAVILAEDDIFTGTVGFNSLLKSYEIAFHLLPAYWGKGIMTEASKAAIDWSKEQGASEIEAFIMPENRQSIGLVHRLDMAPTDEYSDGARRYRTIL